LDPLAGIGAVKPDASGVLAIVMRHVHLSSFFVSARFRQPDAAARRIVARRAILGRLPQSSGAGMRRLGLGLIGRPELALDPTISGAAGGRLGRCGTKFWEIA